MPFDLTLGAVTFQGMEVPETVRSWATKQSVVIQEFPGGLRTIRNLGALPAQMIWHGILTGASALDRMAVIERLAGTGQQVTLSYGPLAWLGEVVHFAADPRQQYFIPYEVTFEPTEDQSGITQGQTAGTTPETSLSVQQQALAAQQAGTATTL